MNKVLISLVSGVALMGLAACSDTDDTTTQGVDGTTTTDPAVPADDTTTAPDAGTTGDAGGGAVGGATAQ